MCVTFCCLENNLGVGGEGRGPLKFNPPAPGCDSFQSIEWPGSDHGDILAKLTLCKIAQ